VRPINLIPPEDRRGDQAPLRTGQLPYVLLGGLIALLIGVIALVLVGNEISDNKGEVVKLTAEDAAASAKAQRLAAYTQFRNMSEQRVATVNSLADSRFDWERVMRELALVLPADTWLTALTASAGGEAEGGAGTGSGLSAGALGPTLQLSGCSSGQEAVAAFVTALKDIDGVTRVGVASSELPDKASGGTGGGGGGDSGAGEECRTRNFIAKFEIVVAFDAAPVPTESAEGAAVSAPVETTEEAGSEGSESSEGG
jgi:Tfp pilus assembly protein PilN